MRKLRMSVERLHKLCSPKSIGIVGGYEFFEHPFHGDEAPLLCVVDNALYDSGFWELPTLEELHHEHPLP